ncbi:MAG: nucleotide exchange factor GrpE [Porticoccus sp.]|nr:nucleotide exchange factor GrpE [Porticoccus sp.]
MSTEENNHHGDYADESGLHQSEQSEVQESVVENKVSDVGDDLAKLQEELVAANEQSLRAHAEMQNLRRRLERDVENAHKYALDKFVGELLPVVDNLERTLQAVDQENVEFTSLTEGVELTLKNFQDVLVRYKVEPIDPKGQVFNPEFHQAMSMVEVPGETPNTVVDVFQKGYTLNGRLVRPAMVVVAKAADK